MDRKFSDSCYFNCDDESAFIPYTAAGDLWDTKYSSVMVWEPVAPGFEAAAMTQFRTAIANRQRFSPSDKRAITMFGREEFKPIMEGITIGIEALLFLIGAMTLGIGGVGVMNIMLVSVTERIREIGLRKALGASPTLIRRQFLVEASVLGLAGGILGALLGIVGALVLPGLISSTITVSPTATVLAILTSIAIGMAFGVYPASRAARLAPIDALRSE